MTHAYDNLLRSPSSDYDVLTADAAFSQYGADTGSSHRRLAGAFVVYAATAVPKIIEIARARQLVLWPISGGRNYGYGSALPAAQHCWVVDLSRLKSIEVDTSSVTVRVGAGVTQGDLRQFLDRRGLTDWMVPTTGAGPNGSLVGNALDGGYGLNPPTDHFEGVNDLQGWWGNGAPFSHVFSELGCPDMANRTTMTVGPKWSGLLHQSNFGIVTSAQLQLVKRPPATCLVLMEFSSEHAFFDSLATLSLLKSHIPGLHGPICTSAARAAASCQPGLLMEALVTSNGMDAQAVLAQLAGLRGFKPWTAMAFLYGTQAAVAAQSRDIKKALKLARVTTLSGKLANGLAHVGKMYLSKWPIGTKLSSLAPAVDLLEGRPSAQFLQLAYAFDTTPRVLDKTANPAQDGVGLHWVAPLVPPEPSSVKAFLSEVCAPVFAKNGLFFMPALTFKSPGVLTAVTPVLYRKHLAKEREAAQTCAAELIAAALRSKFPLYRVGSTFMDQVPGLQDTPSMQMTRQLRTVLDPDGIFSNGRYVG